METPKRKLSFKKNANGNIVVTDGLNGFMVVTGKSYTEAELNELLNKAYAVGYGSGYFDGRTGIK